MNNFQFEDISLTFSSLVARFCHRTCSCNSFKWSSFWTSKQWECSVCFDTFSGGSSLSTSSSTTTSVTSMGIDPHFQGGRGASAAKVLASSSGTLLHVLGQWQFVRNPPWLSQRWSCSLFQFATIWCGNKAVSSHVQITYPGFPCVLPLCSVNSRFPSKALSCVTT